MEKNIFFHCRNPQENILEKYPSPKGEGNNIFPNEYLSRGFQPGKIKNIISALASKQRRDKVTTENMEPRDPSEYNEASYEIDFAAHCDFVEPLSDGVRLFPSEEPLNAYRAASERLMGTLNRFITFLADHGYGKSKTLWGMAYALGHPLTAGMSMLEAARMLGCTKQAISKIACDFLAETGLPPSPALKSEEAKETYKKTNGNRRTKFA